MPRNHPTVIIAPVLVPGITPASAAAPQLSDQGKEAIVVTVTITLLCRAGCLLLDLARKKLGLDDKDAKTGNAGKGGTADSSEKTDKDAAAAAA